MRSFLSFARETLIRGFLFLLPLGLVLLVLGKLFSYAKPVGTAIHDRFFPWAHTDLGPFLFAVLILVVIAFGAGMFGRSRAGHHIFAGIEALVLERLPLYTVFRQMITDMAGAERLSGAATTRTVLVRFDELTSIGFLVERKPTGDVVVFLPDAPSGLSGAVALVQADRITETSLTPKDVLVGMRRLGTGLFDLRAASDKT